MDLNLHYKQDPDIVSREVAGEVILVPVRQNVGDFEHIFTLNETAAIIWRLIDGQNSLKQICDQIVEEYEVNQQQIEEEIIELIKQLEEACAVIRIN